MPHSRPDPEPSPTADACSSLVAWLVDAALPRWATTGVDRAHGGFFEKIDRRGRPLDEPRRTRVVARQIYVFATAARHGWWVGADELVTHGLDFLLNRLRRPDGTFAAAVHPDGRIVRDRFDLYEQAFALFALAEACRDRPDRLPALSPVADTLLGALRAGWQHPLGGFEESRPPSTPLRSNPHMHLFEAALSWEEVAATDAARERWAGLCDEIAALALSRFIEDRTGALSECFDARWQAVDDPVVEPGHQFEWSWLLHRWGRARGRADAIRAARRLNDIGESQGVDASRGTAINELDGRLAARDPGARLWPQTERLKSACAAWLDGGDRPRAIAEAATGIEAFFLPEPVGLWNERQRADGGFEVDDCRASSLYHVVCAIDTLVAADAAARAVAPEPAAASR